MADRVGLIALGQVGDIAVKGRREQDGLPNRVGLVEQPPDLGHEAHVGHAIGFVDHDQVDIGQRDCPLIDEVGQSAGSGNDDVGPFAKGVALRFVSNSSVHGCHRPAAHPGERPQFAGDLLGEFPRRGQDHGSWPAGDRLANHGYQRQAEGEGLARPGRGPTENVAAGHEVGDGGFLNREGFDN